jgi:predicted DNA-binding transcriptional regulator AlpA
VSVALEQSTYLSTDQVRARFGGVSRMWVHRAIRHRGFPKPLKLGGSAQSHSLFPRDQIEAWEASRLHANDNTRAVS